MDQRRWLQGQVASSSSIIIKVISFLICRSSRDKWTVTLNWWLELHWLYNIFEKKTTFHKESWKILKIWKKLGTRLFERKKLRTQTEMFRKDESEEPWQDSRRNSNCAYDYWLCYRTIKKLNQNLERHWVCEKEKIKNKVRLKRTPWTDRTCTSNRT